MAVDYARGLSDYEHKGVCGLPEIRDDEQLIEANIKQLADWIRESSIVVVLVGAGNLIAIFFRTGCHFQFL